MLNNLLEITVNTYNGNNVLHGIELNIYIYIFSYMYSQIELRFVFCC